MADTLKDKSKLTHLLIGSNGIGVEGRSGEEAVVGNDADCFTLFCCLAGAIALAGSLRGKSQLKELTFNNNGIEDEAALALAHAVSSSQRLSTFDLSGNPITSDAVAQIRELVPALSFSPLVSECRSLCPGGSLRFPDALHSPSNMTCSEREAFCLANVTSIQPDGWKGNCGSCRDMQGEALTSTVCCGLREQKCDSKQKCPPDFVFVPGGNLIFPVYKGTFPCGLVPGMYIPVYAAFVPDMPCDEFSNYAALHSSCCIK
jgi:hypothetical protein